MKHFLDEGLGILHWQKHDGSPECPIPWAPKGAYRVISTNAALAGSQIAAKVWNWRKITDWALTDGWIPVIDGRCDQAVGWLAYTWEFKRSDGEVLEGTIDILSPFWTRGTVAVRFLMKPESKLDKSDWVLHSGLGGCPIPWAKSGEWSRRLRNGCTELAVPFVAIDSMGWKHNLGILDTVAWQLTDGWLPVIDGRCPQAVGWKAGEWEWRNAQGDIRQGQRDIEIDTWALAVAVRLIKPTIIHLKTLVSEPILYGFKPGYEAYLRFRASPRGKEALAMIGKAEGPQFKSLGEDTINDIAAEALREHDKHWPRKI